MVMAEFCDGSSLHDDNFIGNFIIQAGKHISTRILISHTEYINISPKTIKDQTDQHRNREDSFFTSRSM